MQTKPKILLLLIALFLLIPLAACQNTASPLPTPTATLAPTAIASPSPTPAPLTQCGIPLDPNREFDFIAEDLLTSYLTFLNAGGDWQKTRSFSAHRLIPLDANADQMQDFLLETPDSLDLLLCTPQGFQSHALQHTLQTPTHKTVQTHLLTYGDYNQNTYPEFILEAPFCDLDFCYNHLEILEWRHQGLTNIFDGSIDDLRYPSASLEKIDGIYHLIVRSNPLETTRSGLVRSEERHYAPTSPDAQWTLLNKAYDLSPYRLHYLLDGENAYANGDFELAKAFYLSVVYDQSLLDYKAEQYPQQVENIVAVAQMRLVELHFRAGENAEAHELYQWMDENYAYGTPAFRIRGLARAWVLNYQENGLDATVQAMHDYISFFYTDFQSLFDESYYGTLNALPLEVLAYLP